MPARADALTPPERIIEATRRRLGLATREDAIRHLLHEGAKRRVRFSESKLAKFRLPEEHRDGRTWSSEEIDELLYGDPEKRG